MNDLRIKRIYEKPEERDGLRILVDRLWPRGMRKETAKLDIWMKEIAPSHELRSWFEHREDRWEEFRERYFEELKGKEELIFKLKELWKNQTVTLLIAATDKERNNAVAVQEFLTRELSKVH